MRRIAWPRPLQGRLFDELRHRIGRACALAAADIAVAGLRRVRHVPKVTSLPSSSQCRGGFGRGLEHARITDHVIGRHHQGCGIRIKLLRLERRERDGRRRIAAGGFKQNRRRRDPQHADLFGDREAVRLVAHDDGRLSAGDARQPRHRVLQYGQFAGERQQLLGIRLARQRPELRAGAAGQNNWNQ